MCAVCSLCLHLSGSFSSAKAPPSAADTQTEQSVSRTERQRVSDSIGRHCSPLRYGRLRRFCPLPTHLSACRTCWRFEIRPRPMVQVGSMAVWFFSLTAASCPSQIGPAAQHQLRLIRRVECSISFLCSNNDCPCWQPRAPVMTFVFSICFVFFFVGIIHSSQCIAVHC